MPRGHHHHDHHHHHGPGILGAVVVGAAVGAAASSHHHHHSPSPSSHPPVEVKVVTPAPAPVYVAPAPVYVAPAPSPVYVAPAPAYPPQQGYGVAPAPIYVAPAPAPVYVAPAPAVVSVSVSPAVRQPIRAVKLGKKWKDGNIILLHNMSTHKNMRINKRGVVEGCGKEGKWAQFVVERTGGDRVKLRNVGHGNAYLRCTGPHHLDHGPGGPQCEFYVVKHGKCGGECAYSLESVSHPGFYVGFFENGSVKPPHQTGLGPHGTFHVKVVKWH